MTRNYPPWCLCLGSDLTISQAHTHKHFDYFKGLASKDEFNALNNLRKKMKSYFFSPLFSQYFSSSSCSEHHAFFIL